MFSGLRQGNLFFVLEKGERPTLKIGQVTSVSNIQNKYGQMIPGQMFGPNVEQIVDISAKIGEETMEFKQLPANLSIANFGQNGVVVSESREAMSSEVEGMLRLSKDVLESVSYHKGVIEACDSILRELNPQFAKEKDQEEKINTLESKVSGIEGTLSDIKSMLSKTLNSGAAKK